MANRILTVLLSVLFPLAAQRTSSTFNWTSENVALTAELNQVNVDLGNGSAIPFVLGLRVDSLGPNTASLIDIGYTKQQMRGGAVLRRLTSITPVPKQRYSISDNTIHLVCSPDPGAVTALFIVVTKRVTLRVISQDGLVVNRVVSDGVVVQNGVVSSVVPEGIHQLPLFVFNPDTPMRGPSEPTPKGGAHSVNLASLRSHLINFERPSAADGATRSRAASLKIEIDNMGHVASVSGWGVSLLSAEGLNTVKNWTFTPFSVAGNSVRIVADVPFRIESDGTVACALDPLARAY